MGRSKRKVENALEVTIMFEPSRLAVDHLAEAYRQVVPPQGRKRKPGELAVDEVPPEIQAPSGSRRWPS